MTTLHTELKHQLIVWKKKPTKKRRRSTFLDDLQAGGVREVEMIAADRVRYRTCLLTIIPQETEELNAKC